ncbi:MAG TPA: bifunctional class I SAM-dependent methyltransferase/glycosyltransferase family 2 protein [Gemmataceae bacterium]|jgi:SAM-dependent methyltransferase|nr:bifunctional class I SAM-dependent methyltransferase/glycosyltransferase family 2 protein [Gemmataceae bacterium]
MQGTRSEFQANSALPLAAPSAQALSAGPSRLCSPEDDTLLKQCQRRRADLLAAHFDGLANDWERFRARNEYFHYTLRALFLANVPPDSSVLEFGCATGDLLAVLQPRRGLGVDLSPQMVAKARRKYPHLEFVEGDAVSFDTEERFDCILLNNFLEYVEDIQGLFRNCRRLLKSRGRVLITTLNPLWTPLLRLAARLGLRTPDPSLNYITGADTVNLLRLNGFEVVKQQRRTLLPRRIPLVSFLVNLVASQLPLLRRLCVTEFLVARPTGAAGDYSVSVIVPCYNEAGNIEACVRRVPRMGLRTEVLVVDDGSQDGTADRVRPELNPAVEVRCISYQPNQGKLHAVRTGFDAARGDILMILDADMTVPPEDLPYFYGPLHEGLADFINGTRLIYPLASGSMKLTNYIGNKLFGGLVSWLTGIHISDTLCGTKAFFREDYRYFLTGYDPWGDFDWLFGAAQHSRKILEVPIHYQERRAGQSKMKALRHTWALLKACWFGFWRLKYPRKSVGKAQPAVAR